MNSAFIHLAARRGWYQTGGQMVAELKANGHLENTLVIVTANHVQSPIDPKLYSAHPGKNSQRDDSGEAAGDYAA